MPPEADAKARRRRYWLTWWFWPWLLLLGRDRRSDWPAIHNSLVTAWWVRIGTVFMLVAAMLWQLEPREQTLATRVFLGLVFALGLIALVAGVIISTRQRRAALRTTEDDPLRHDLRRERSRAHGWRYWLRVWCWPLVLPLRCTWLPGDYDQFREWINWRIAGGLVAWGAMLLAVLLAALGPYWFPAVEAVHRALAWLLGRDPAKAQELMLPSLLIVFGVPVALIAGLVWQVRRRSRYRANEEYLEQIRQQGRDEK